MGNPIEFYIFDDAPNPNLRRAFGLSMVSLRAEIGRVDVSSAIQPH